MELTLLPSRRVLNIEPDETVLAALLRQDAPISHSCKDGRCGLCRCALSVPDFSSVGKSLNDMTYVLACQTTPNADCLVEIPDPDDILVLPPQVARGSIVEIDAP
ncbi:MAG: 2Fe-2S iron-sulfur cluster binding domain-containing protein, partial [Oricola sp.]|nr:2Fe-2S iron-sulfur cluster binding domain-containing protein [Oricola sp.]